MVKFSKLNKLVDDVHRNNLKIKKDLGTLKMFIAEMEKDWEQDHTTILEMVREQIQNFTIKG